VAEIEGLYQATVEAKWIVGFWKELTGRNLAPVTVFQDNNAVISLVNGDKTIERAKHETVKIHFLRQKVLDGLIQVKRKPTEEMMADVLSKSLGKNKHWEHVQNMGIHLPNGLKGSVMVCG
jgi:hypothetical protein